MALSPELAAAIRLRIVEAWHLLRSPRSTASQKAVARAFIDQWGVATSAPIITTA